MYSRHFITITILLSFCLVPGLTSLAVAGQPDDSNDLPTKIYVPYEELTSVFENEQQGVFLPYRDFQKLWQAAQGKPANVLKAPFEYLISTARFDGKVEEEIAAIKLELTIDILSDDWVQVPLGLGEVAVSKATLLDSAESKIDPLLMVVDGRYLLTVKGKGRYVLQLDFVCRLDTQPGLAVLTYHLPSAAITTLDLLIPEENLKVDVEPMLAATTSGATVGDTGATRLQAFLGSTTKVSLSWKPKTQAAQELEPVIICEQFQHINIDEALISQQVTLNYNIHRGGVDSFSIRLPNEFRITEVNGSNIARWDIDANAVDQGQLLKVELFSQVKDLYTLTVKMERFLQERQAQVQLRPIFAEQTFRQSGLIGITYSPRRSVHVENISNLARVDTGQLPSNLQNRTGVTAYRFITSDYGATLAIGTTLPRISVTQRWLLGVDSDRLQLQGGLFYNIEKTGIFELNMNFPEPWEIESIGPAQLVDDHQLIGDGPDRQLHILLKRETIGDFDLTLAAKTDRAQPDEIVDFNLPVPDPNNLHLYEGQLVLLMAEQLQAEIGQINQIQAIPIRQAPVWASMEGLSPVMAFDFHVIDSDSPAGGSFNIAVKPTQISAIVHRLVNIQSGSIDHEAIIQYTIRYAPVDTLYIKVPAQFADDGIEISGPNIKEKPRIDQLPADQIIDANDTTDQQTEWAYYKIVLQSKVNNSYQLRVTARRTFLAGEVGQAEMVEVYPILAAGKLSDQNGHIAVTKAETLAIAQPVTENLTPADPGSSIDLPYTPHRRSASLAFKYSKPYYQLTLPVVVQAEATVFTTIVSGAVIEQALARDGMLNTHATFFLATSQGDRLMVTLPKKAELTAVLLNGNEAPVELGTSANQRIVRLPPSAGQVSKFMLEISYGLKGAWSFKLTAPQLSKEILVQQTLWRVWIPEGFYYLGHNKVFSRLTDSQSQSLLYTFQREVSRQGNFKLTGQGQVFNFVRQGSPGKLSVMAMGKEIFSILIWAIIIGGGIYMLKLNCNDRIIIILAIILFAGLLHLFQPVFVKQTLKTGIFAIVLVILLWLSQWGRTMLPQLQQQAAIRRQKKLEKNQNKKAQTETEQKSSHDENKQ